MADTIGRIAVPESAFVATFSFVSDFLPGRAVARPVIAHAFGDPRVEQRFFVGDPATRYTFLRRTLTNADRITLAQFWREAQGGRAWFLSAVPLKGQASARPSVRFETGPLALEDLAGAICSTGITFVE